MLPRVLKYSGANFWDLKEDQVDFDEMKGAYLRATQDDIVTRLRVQSLALKNNKYFSGIADDWYAEAADEIERLRATLYVAESDRDYYHQQLDPVGKSLRELQSEVQRLEKLANYGQ